MIQVELTPGLADACGLLVIGFCSEQLLLSEAHGLFRRDRSDLLLLFQFHLSCVIHLFGGPLLLLRAR